MSRIRTGRKMSGGELGYLSLRCTQAPLERGSQKLALILRVTMTGRNHRLPDESLSLTAVQLLLYYHATQDHQSSLRAGGYGESFLGPFPKAWRGARHVGAS